MSSHEVKQRLFERYHQNTGNTTSARNFANVEQARNDNDDVDQDFSLPRNSEPSSYIDFEQVQQTSMENHLPSSNVGYRLLERMGWKKGSGLGALGQGRTDPVRIELKQDSLGVGKAGQDQEYNDLSTARRKALDSEKQLEETLEERQLRQQKVIKEQEIQQELKHVTRAFYCELCDKQYSKVSEYDQHLQSYDHHHKKRFKDMKEQTKKSAIGQSAIEKKRERERRREEKEMKRMQEAIMKKHNLPPPPSHPVSMVTSSNTGTPSSAPPPPPPPPEESSLSDIYSSLPPPPPPPPASFSSSSPPPPPPPSAPSISPVSSSSPSTTSKVSFGFGVKRKASGIRFGLQKKGG